MPRKVIAGVAGLAIAAIAAFALTYGGGKVDAASRPAQDELLGWDEIVSDTRHSWFWTQNADPYGADMLDASLWMYQITGDKFYLDYIRNGFGDSPLEGTDRRQAVIVLAKLAMADSHYAGQAGGMADAMMEQEIDPATGLFYASDGRREMYIPYDGAQGIEALLMACEATSDGKYLSQAKKTIDAVWETRDRNTDLISSWLYSYRASAKVDYMQHYGSGAFLKTVLHYYYLSGDKHALDIATRYASALERYAWDGKRWNYRTDMDGKPSSLLGELAEANFAKLDDAMLLVHDLKPDASGDAYGKAKGDYDTTFLNGLILSNGLVKHSVRDDGSDHSAHQSVIRHAFAAIQNPAMRLYGDTGNKTYIGSLNAYYHSVIAHHKRANGYASAIDPYSFQDDQYDQSIDYRATGFIANKVYAMIAPSHGVHIVWARVGSAQLYEPLIVHYDDAGRFNAVKFDLGKKEIVMDAVSGMGTIAFPGNIAWATIDGNEYQAFEGNVLKTQEGTHGYSVRLIR